MASWSMEVLVGLAAKTVESMERALERSTGLMVTDAETLVIKVVVLVTVTILVVVVVAATAAGFRMSFASWASDGLLFINDWKFSLNPSGFCLNDAYPLGVR